MTYDAYSHCFGELTSQTTARLRLGQKTSFTVSIWESAESPEPLETVQVVAKMPLSAMIFALQQARISRAGYVLVSDGEMEAEFYHVKLTGKHITYDRAVPGPPPDQQG